MFLSDLGLAGLAVALPEEALVERTEVLPPLG
jgi:hypothetical protein